MYDSLQRARGWGYASEGSHTSIKLFFEARCWFVIKMSKSLIAFRFWLLPSINLLFAGTSNSCFHGIIRQTANWKLICAERRSLNLEARAKKVLHWLGLTDRCQEPKEEGGSGSMTFSHDSVFRPFFDARGERTDERWVPMSQCLKYK